MWRVIRIYIVKSMPLLGSHSHLVMLHSLKEYPLKGKCHSEYLVLFILKSMWLFALVGEEQLHRALQILPCSFETSALWQLFLKAVVRGSHRGLALPSLHTTLAWGLSAWKQGVQQQERMGGVTAPSRPLVLSGVRTELNPASASHPCPGPMDIPDPLVMPLTQVWAPDFAV